MDSRKSVFSGPDVPFSLGIQYCPLVDVSLGSEFSRGNCLQLHCGHCQARLFFWASAWHAKNKAVRDFIAAAADAGICLQRFVIAVVCLGCCLRHVWGVNFVAGWRRLLVNCKCGCLLVLDFASIGNTPLRLSPSPRYITLRKLEVVETASELLDAALSDTPADEYMGCLLHMSLRRPCRVQITVHTATQFCHIGF